MSTNDALSAISQMDEDFVSYIITIIIIIIIIIITSYLVHINRLEKSQCNYMNNLYPSINGNIRPISANDPDCSGNLNEYYIKSAYNCCSGGSYKNDFVSICNLKAILNQGVRALDFEIYSVDNIPIVSTSTSDDYFIKETYNSVDFSEVISCITNYAFSASTSPNYTDPILIHLRIKSTNQEMYTNLANIFKSYSSFMLGKEYSFENFNKNIGEEPLLNFQKKIIIIVDKSNNSYLENKDLLEYINITSNSIFMRALHYYDVKNTPDINELQNFNRRGMTIGLPDKGINPPNPSGILSRETGCQMVAMRYQYVDSNLKENTLFFDRAGYAFSLKPLRLRYTRVLIDRPTPQNPELSYRTRNVTTDFYSFNF